MYAKVQIRYYQEKPHCANYYSAMRLTVANQQTFTFDNLPVCVNMLTQQSMQRCSNYNHMNFSRRRDCQ